MSSDPGHDATDMPESIGSDELDPPAQREPLPRLRGRALRRHLEAREPLQAIDLRRARLRGLDLENADLSGVDLSGADLRGTNLAGADLRDARLDYVDASRADLRRADLGGVWFLDTDLTGADLRGADLSRCLNLTMANLKRVQWDATTSWPPGLDPETRTARPAL